MFRVFQPFTILLFACVAFCAQRAEAGFVTVETDRDWVSFEDLSQSESMSPATSEPAEAPVSLLAELLGLDRSPQALQQSNSNGASSAGSSSGPSTGSVAMLPLELRLLPTLITPLQVRDLAFSPQCVISGLFRPPCA